MEQPVFISKKCNNIINVTSIVTLHYFEFPNDYEFEGESHAFWELLYVDKGSFLVTSDGREHVLKQGEAIFHKPDEFHTNKAYNHTSANVFVITFVCNSRAMKFFRNKVVTLSSSYKKLIANIIEMSRSTYDITFNDINARELVFCENSIIGGQQLIRLYLEQFLVMQLQENTTLPNKSVYESMDVFDDVVVNQIISILKEHIYTTITIEEICQKLNYSKTYLSIFFKNKTGKSIIEYYRYLKVKEAKVLLRSGNYNVSQVSAALSFANPYYFSNVFKTITKMSPREYMRTVEGNR